MGDSGLLLVIKIPYMQHKLHCTWPAKKPHTPMMHKMLKTAEPTMVPTPTSPLVMKTPEEGVTHAA